MCCRCCNSNESKCCRIIFLPPSRCLVSTISMQLCQFLPFLQRLAKVWETLKLFTIGYKMQSVTTALIRRPRRWCGGIPMKLSGSHSEGCRFDAPSCKREKICRKMLWNAFCRSVVKWTAHWFCSKLLANTSCWRHCAVVLQRVSNFGFILD